MSLTAAHTLLRDKFGFPEFRPGQAEVIEHLLAGRSSLAVFPTGSGKSLCYQLPALLLDGLTLVVSPLIALMKDQTDFLRARGIEAARLDSSVSAETFAEIQKALRERRLKLLYVAPERFANERFLARLQTLAIDLMVVDEAHCISEWGHNFRPDYLKLARIARDVRVGRVLALTATATPGVARDICREFAIAPEAHVHTGFYRPNLFLRTTVCAAGRRLGALIERLRSRPNGPTIVYVTLQKTAEAVAGALAEAGFPAEAYHAGMEPDAREAVQNTFMAGADGIVVATIAFGMGIDKADIRAVYHYNLPKSLENYAQEIGRAGRDGLPSHCEILAAGDDLTVLENFTYGDTPEPEALRNLVADVLQGRAAGELFDVSTHELSTRHDIRPLVVSTALTYLELDGLIAATAPFYTSHQWRFLRPREEIVAGFDAKRQAFLEQMFDSAKAGRTWFTVDLTEAAAAMGGQRERMVRALNFLEERGHITLRAAGVRQGYRVAQVPEDLTSVGGELLRRFAAREQSDIARLRAVTELLEGSGCLVRRLLAYFGEELGRDCGHCGACAGDEPSSLARARASTAISFPEEELAMLRAEHPRALRAARQITRFLCGLNSPALTAARLTRHPRFGCMAEQPFGEVAERVNAVMGASAPRDE
ncbi:MAG TPA: RecQ family ATP-dependent DNA helicase [Verrucomicrobiales bacterium]|nr:RecQ family ATP-dependent DNA helicase [Verrucomicrobiales bacterium]